MLAIITFFLLCSCRSCKSDVEIKIDDRRFAHSVGKRDSNPILRAIIRPAAEPVTDGYSMTDPATYQRVDSIHYRSLWFGQGDIGNVNFWTDAGVVQHRKFVKIESGLEAVDVAQTTVSLPNFSS